MQRILITKDKRLFIKDISVDYHCQYGMIKKAQLKKKSGIVKTNTGKELTIMEPSFIDKYYKIKRLPQIIPLKDIGPIITKTGLGKNSKVIDAGSGSGALCLMLANIVKEVITYELREDFFDVVKKNIEYLELTNIKIKNTDVCKATERNVDVITLDLPDPWTPVNNLRKCLKKSGFIVSYSPTIPQVMDFVTEVQKHDDLIFLETIEILERQWEVNERKVRPKSQQIGHSGFLTFVRKV